MTVSSSKFRNRKSLPQPLQLGLRLSAAAAELVPRRVINLP